MGFDFSKSSGEAFGDIEDVFFKKDGKDFLNNPEHQSSEGTVNLAELGASIQQKASSVQNKINEQQLGNTTIQISKDVIGEDEDLIINLDALEQLRFNNSTVRNKSFIDVNNGETITVNDKTKLYNGTYLYTVTTDTGENITYPRGMFIGPSKKFVPSDFYIREAERLIEDTIDKHTPQIKEYVSTSGSMVETSDTKYLEMVLQEPIPLIGIIVPNNIKIPVKRLFDMQYKILMLEFVICIDNKIAGLIFDDIWF